MKHFGDPCIHCGTPHDEVGVGNCPGDVDKARVLAYCVDRQAWQNPGSGCDTVLMLMTTGGLREEAHHPSDHWPYSERFKSADVLSRQEFHRLFCKPTEPGEGDQHGG